MVRIFKIHVKVLKIRHRTHTRGRLGVRFTTADPCPRPAPKPVVVWHPSWAMVLPSLLSKIRGMP